MLCVCQFSDKEAACFENVENTVAPERIWKWGGAPVRRESGGIDPALSAGYFFGSCPSTFMALKVQLVVLVSAFVMVGTVWLVSCFGFFPPCPVKVGARSPLRHMESAPLRTHIFKQCPEEMETLSAYRNCTYGLHEVGLLTNRH